MKFVEAGNRRFLVGDIALPEQEQERMSRDMRGLMDDFKANLRSRLTSYSFKHPTRGDPLYVFLALDGTQEYTMEYFQARDKAMRVANDFAPRIGRFFDKEVARTFEELDQAIHKCANRHVQDLADQRLLGYAIIPKYTALKAAAQDICKAITNGPALSYDPILGRMWKMPVEGRGIYASVEGMKNIHKVDEYQVVCAVAEQLADFATGFLELPAWHTIHDGIQRRIVHTEAVQVPLSDPEI